MTNKPTDAERIVLLMPRGLIKRIEDYRWATRTPSVSEAIRRLVDDGLRNFDHKDVKSSRSKSRVPPQ